jgi:hypothetical protein
VSTRTTSSADSERDKRLRAELAAELGWYPADLDDESIARHRADAARKKTDRDPAKKWPHLTELARQRDVEQRVREEVADLYECVDSGGYPALNLCDQSPIMGCREPRSVLPGARE